jgi:mycothiol synthase
MTTPVQVHESKLPDGFTLRPVHMEDLEGVEKTLNAYSIAMYGKAEDSIENILLEWKMPEIDITESHRVVVAPDGTIAGYMECWTYQKPPVHPWLWGRVHPDYEGLGVGTVLMEWAIERARNISGADCPPEARIACMAGCKSGHRPSEELFENLGMTPIRHSWTMLIEMDEKPLVSPLPAGISIRAYRHDEDLEAALIATNDAFRDHWGFVEQPLEIGLERWRYWIEEDTLFDAGLWFLAIDDTSGEIAAISLNRNPARHDDTMGWVNTLGVRRAWSKQGLGLAILQQTFLEFWNRGMHRVGLGVDASSLTGATRLYEKAGMHIDREVVSYELEIRPGVELATTSVED